MNISCGIIKDLLPLYHDGVCSEETKIIIEEHLKICDDCKSYLDNIDKEILYYSNTSKEEKAKINILKELRKRFIKKKTFIVLISLLCVVALALGTYKFVTYKFSVAYSDNMLSSEKSENIMDILSNPDYYMSHIIWKQIEKDGAEQYVAYIYYTQSLWDVATDAARGTCTYNSLSPIDFSAEMRDDMNMAENISAVYYFVGDYGSLCGLPDDKFFETAKDAVLIWKNNQTK